MKKKQLWAVVHPALEKEIRELSKTTGYSVSHIISECIKRSLKSVKRSLSTWQMEEDDDSDLS